jgi:hypothetical protein
MYLNNDNLIKRIYYTKEVTYTRILSNNDITLRNQSAGKVKKSIFCFEQENIKMCIHHVIPWKGKTSNN